MASTLAPPDLQLRSNDATWNRARWERLPADGNRYEVIDGVLYMTTAPSSFHQWIVQELYSALRAQLQDSGFGLVFIAPIGLFMPGCDPVQPDVLVVRASDRHVFQESRIVGVPALIVEVQSPSNASYDSRTKREAYARAGVPEYWIVRPATRDVLVCAQPDAGGSDFMRSQVFGAGDELTSPTLPIALRVASLFEDAPDTTL
jgi:Uma2 family endonuclease